MQTHRSHTAKSFRCLILLSAVMVFFVITENSGNKGLYSSQIAQNTFDTEWINLTETGDSSEIPEQPPTIYKQELTEAPRQQQTTSAPYKHSILKKEIIPPTPDFKDLLPDQSL